MSIQNRIRIQGLGPALAAALAEHLGPGSLQSSEKDSPAAPDILVTADPVLALASRARHPDVDVVFCLSGAGQKPPDDVLAVFTPPFRLGSLLSRLHAALEFRDSQRAQNFDLGLWQFRPREKMLFPVRGSTAEPVRLTDKETALLVYLEARGSVVSRDELLAKIWSYSESVTTHTLETHIWRLRQKIENDPSLPRILITESDGYRLKTGPHLP